jgi:hypothetical protein
MSASEPERTHAADDKSEERFQQYLPVAPLDFAGARVGGPPFRYTDHISRLLLLIYKIVLIGPVIATIILIWREVRHVRYETKDPA